MCCEFQILLESAGKEIKAWRRFFLDQKFAKGPFSCISEKHREYITGYFLSTPSEVFTDPQNEFDNCVSYWLQSLKDK